MIIVIFIILFFYFKSTNVDYEDITEQTTFTDNKIKTMVDDWYNIADDAIYYTQYEQGFLNLNKEARKQFYTIWNKYHYNEFGGFLRFLKEHTPSSYTGLIGYFDVTPALLEPANYFVYEKTILKVEKDINLKVKLV